MLAFIIDQIWANVNVGEEVADGPKTASTKGSGTWGAQLEHRDTSFLDHYMFAFQE